MPTISAPSTLNDRSTSLVTFKILSDGDDVTTRIGVVGIAVTYAIGKVASAILTLSEGDIPNQTMPTSDADTFITGKPIEIKVGYHSQEDTIFKGIIVRHRVSVLRNKPIQLIVECKDPSVKMTVRRRSAYFYEQTDSAIIEQIISDYNGLEADIDRTDMNHPCLVQHNASDWDFAVSRAESQGLLVWTADGKFYAKKPDFGSNPLKTLSYATGGIIEFEADIDARNSFSTVESAAWDEAQQSLTTESASEPDGYTEQGNLSASSIADEGVHAETLRLLRGGYLEAIELQTWADAQLSRSRLAKIRGRVSIIGTPDIKPMHWLTFDGMGARFQGKTMVSAVRHEILRGVWTTHCEFGLSPQFFSQTASDIQATAAAGLLPAVHGLHIGRVTKLEGDDVGNGSRIQVVIPYLDAAGQQSDGIWARFANTTAGDNRGFVFRPELNDEVIVGFLNDDPRDAIVLGSLYAPNRAVPVTAADDNNEKGIYCREGMKLVFNDEEKSVTITTSGNNTILINDNDQTIKIEDQRGAKLEFTTSGITLDAGSGVLEIKGSMVKINS
jgi:Rhs element Vgr protein